MNNTGSLSAELDRIALTFLAEATVPSRDACGVAASSRESLRTRREGEP